MSSIIEDFGSIGATLKQLETAKSEQHASESADLTEVRHEFYSMYGLGYQAPKEDAA